MARFYACGSPHQNLLLGGKDKLTDSAPTEGDNTIIPTVSRVHTPSLVLAPNPAEQVLKYTNDDLQRVTKLALQLFRLGQ